jgi:hypothetical protein
LYLPFHGSPVILTHWSVRSAFQVPTAILNSAVYSSVHYLYSLGY